MGQELYISEATKAVCNSGLLKHGHTKAAVMLLEHGIKMYENKSSEFGMTVDYTPEQIEELYKCLIGIARRLRLQKLYKEYKRSFAEFKKRGV